MHAPLPPPPVPVETLLLAYRSGIFPMADRREDTEVFWVEPRERAILPLDGLNISKSLRKVLRADRYTVTLDQAFEQVIRACAEPREDHPETWISERIVQSYLGLHRAGHAHSVECWSIDDAGNRQLVGGLYGVSFDRVFCGESMFSRVPDASKVALCWLVAALRHANATLLDCQFMTEHLASLGAVEISQAEYLVRLRAAQSATDGAGAAALGDGVGDGLADGLGVGAGVALPDGFAALLAAAAAGSSSSPGNFIAQSLTQTS